MRWFGIATVVLLTCMVSMAACGDDATGPGPDGTADTALTPDLGEIGGGDAADTGASETVDTTPNDVGSPETLGDTTTPNDTGSPETVGDTTTPDDTGSPEVSDTTTPNDTGSPETSNDTAGETIIPEGTSAQIQALITAATGASAPIPVAIQVDNATVTMVKLPVGSEPAGFFIQADEAGPAIFVVHTGAAAIVRNDIVSFKATELTRTGGVMMVTVFSELEVEAGGGDADRLIQDISGLALAGMYDQLASEHVAFEGQLVGDFGPAGEGYSSAQIVTDGVTVASDTLKIRLPVALVTALAIGDGCLIEVSRGVVWRFLSASGTFDQMQPSVYEDWDIFAVCDGPSLVSTVAASATEVILSFDKAVDPASITNPSAQFTINNGLTVSAAAVVGTTVKLTTSDQVAGTTYVVTVASSVTDVADRAVSASAQAGTFQGFAGLVKLIINEVDYDQPDTAGDVGEFIEIYNPNDTAVDLARYQIQTINGDSASAPKIAASYALSGSIPAKGYAVIATAPVSVDGQATVVRFVNAKDNIQNGARDGVRIVTAPGEIVVDTLLYETPANADPALLAYAEGTPISGGEGGGEPNETLSRCPNASDTDNNAVDFALSATPTPGKANVCP